MLALTVTFAAGCGSESAAERKSRPSTSSQGSPAALPCTGGEERTNFTLYSLGPKFEDLPLSRDPERRCTRAPAGAAPAMRLNLVSYTYGDCKPIPGSEHQNCNYPLEVQAWPLCERDPAELKPSHHNPLAGTVRIRGVPGRLYEGGRRLELFTGDATVVIFGDQARVLRAGRALVKAPRNPAGRVVAGDTGAPLPPPPAGPQPCG